MKVELFCVGAAKAGTTSIFEFLKESNQVLLPEDKEPHYFGEYCVGPKKFNNIEEYHSNYLIKDPNKLAVDFSTSYLYSKSAAQQIYDYNPFAKIIIVLRDPVERAISLYNHQKRSMLENQSMDKAFLDEEKRINMRYDYGFHYKSSGLYFEQVKRFYEIFPAEQILIVEFKDLTKNPKETLGRILEFYCITDMKGKNLVLPQENKTGLPKNKIIQILLVRKYPFKNILKKFIPKALINKVKYKNVGRKEAASDTLKVELKKFFEKDQAKLKELLIKYIKV